MPCSQWSTYEKLVPVLCRAKNKMASVKKRIRSKKGLLYAGLERFCLCKTGQFESIDGGFVHGQQKSGDKIKEWPIIYLEN